MSNLMKSFKLLFTLFLFLTLSVIILEKSFIRSIDYKPAYLNQSNNPIPKIFNSILSSKNLLTGEKQSCVPTKFDWNGKEAKEAVRESYERIHHQSIACPLNGTKVNLLNKLIKITEKVLENGSELYNITLQIDEIKNAFKLTADPNFTVQKFDKPMDQSENRKLVFGETLNKTGKYSVITNLTGFYHVNCFKNDINKTHVFSYTYTVLPVDMNKLKETTSPYRKAIDGMLAPFKHSPVASDTDFDRCETDNSKTNDSTKMNILMIGFDSISNYNFRRVFPLTYQYLDGAEDATIFENFNTIAENTYPNHLGMLCGIGAEQSEFNISMEIDFLRNIDCQRKYHDQFPWIFREFEKNGYVTMFQEDDPELGMANYLLNGFRYHPTNLYMYPFVVNYLRNRAGPGKCHHSKPTHLTWYDNIAQFIERMNTPANKKTPYFSITFISDYTHNNVAVPKDMDKGLRDLLVNFEKKGMLKDTAVMLYGDHGNRMNGFGIYTNQGVFERNRPFFGLKLPSRFKNTVFMENVRNNKERLASFFDTYKTLRHLLYLSEYNPNLKPVESSDKCNQQFRESTPKTRSLRGISFLETIPKSRTCIDALIPAKRCSCSDQVDISELRFRNETNQTMNQAAQYIVDNINNIFDKKRELCQKYELEKLVIVKKLRGTSKYRFQLRAEPGSALFDTIIQLENMKFTQQDNPTRLSKYGNTSHCISDKDNKNYCYCKKQL